MSKIKVIILIIFVIIITSVVFQNRNTIMTINFLWWDFQMSVFAIPVIVIFSIAIGYLIAAIYIPRRGKKRQDKS